MSEYFELVDWSLTISTSIICDDRSRSTGRKFETNIINRAGDFKINRAVVGGFKPPIYVSELLISHVNVNYACLSPMLIQPVNHVAVHDFQAPLMMVMNNIFLIRGILSEEIQVCSLIQISLNGVLKRQMVFGDNSK